VDSFTAGMQTRTSRARESSVTHKSAITDHAMEENHVIDWDKVKVVDREAQRQTRWIKEAVWIKKTPICMNRDAGSYQLSDTLVGSGDFQVTCSIELYTVKQDVIKMSDGH